LVGKREAMDMNRGRKKHRLYQHDLREHWKTKRNRNNYTSQKGFVSKRERWKKEKKKNTHAYSIHFTEPRHPVWKEYKKNETETETKTSKIQ